VKKSIQAETLEALISDQALRECRAVRVDGGWSLQGRIGLSWRPVRSRRESVRVWPSLTAVERFCVKLGLKQLVVEL
jgi:hypothetical protein